MTFILRWPAILVLLALVLVSLAGALAAAGVVTGYEVPVAQVQEAQAAAFESGAAQATWLDVGLLAGAAICFLIAAVRLMRRTQGFWTWLLGFALFGGRWAWSQQQNGGLAATLQDVDVNAYAKPAELAANTGSAEAQIGLLAIVVIVGLFVFIVDAADRAYWDKQGA